MHTAEYWIKSLNLIAHPEGGYFGEVYRSSETVAGNALPARFKGERSLATGIYFLIKKNRFSALHRLKADEIWHFYTGSPLEISMIMPDGNLKHHHMGADFTTGQHFQVVVPAGCWFGASVMDTHPEAFALVGCTVAPGFDYTDFELGNRQLLLAEYPQHQQTILQLTRE